jgi:hypothetical protein
MFILWVALLATVFLGSLTRFAAQCRENPRKYLFGINPRNRNSFSKLNILTAGGTVKLKCFVSWVRPKQIPSNFPSLIPPPLQYSLHIVPPSNPSLSKPSLLSPGKFAYYCGDQ